MRHHRETAAVHAGRASGVPIPLIDLATTYPLGDLDDAVASFDALAQGAGTPPGSPIYARLHNPTVAGFEAGLAELELTEDAVAFGSGMAALTATLLAVRARGKTHVVAIRPLYGGSDHLLSSGLLGIDVVWADADSIASAIRPNTGLILLETPANPTLDLVDIARVVHAAGEIPVLVDNTFATPIRQTPSAHGATFVLHSATKFLGGHSDVMGGVVATNHRWAERIRQVRIVTGGLLHPMAGYLLHRGLQTLPLRVRAQERSATVLAQRLSEHPRVKRVHYPAIPGQDPQKLLGRQMTGPGSLISFHVHGGFQAARQILSSLTLILPAVSLGAVESLIQHPAGLTHRLLPTSVREEHGVSDDLLRLSVGLEHPADLWSDLSQVLNRVGERMIPVRQEHLRWKESPVTSVGSGTSDSLNHR